MVINKKISHTLLHLTKNVNLRFHVNLTGKNKDGFIEVPNAFHTVYEFNQGRYISFEVYSYLTLDIKGEVWDRSKSIMITTRNIFQFITHINRIIANIYKQDCFYLDKDNETKLNVDKLEDYTVRGYNLTMDQRIVIEPSLVYEVVEDTMYEGANFYINNSDNMFSVPIDVIESLKYTLEKFDFVLYTSAMLTYYFQRVWKPEDDQLEQNKPIKKQHVFSVKNKSEDVKQTEDNIVQSTRIINEESKEEIFDI